MKLYFRTRSDARNFRAKSSSSVKVLDSKNNPNPNGRRWAVEISPKAR